MQNRIRSRRQVHLCTRVASPSLTSYRSFGAKVRKNTHIITDNKELIYFFGAEHKHAGEPKPGHAEIPLPRCALVCMRAGVSRSFHCTVCQCGSTQV